MQRGVKRFKAVVLLSLCFVVPAWNAVGSEAQDMAAPAKPKAATVDKAMPAKAAEANDGTLETRVYNVTDLVIPKPAYRFQGMWLPGGAAGTGFSGFGGFGGGMGGMGGMGMGGMGMGGMGAGGGLYSVQDNVAQPPPQGASGTSPPAQGGQVPPQPAGGMGSPFQAKPESAGFTVDDLAQAIEQSVEPQSWEAAGGPGSIRRLGGMLVVNQVPAIHAKIQKFLEAVREAGEGQRIINVRARWLLLDSKQLQQLSQGKAEKEAAIDRAALDAITAKAKGYQGEVSCFDGQTVFIVSGRNKSLVIGAIPVADGSGVGYQPLTVMPQTGLLLQLTPQLLPKGQTVVVDLQSVFTQLGDTPGPAPFLSSKTAGGGRTEGVPEGGGLQLREKAPVAPSQTTITLDRVNMVVQQLATTVRLPLGQTMLVGGLTLEPPTDANWTADQVPQLYLFIEATAR